MRAVKRGGGVAAARYRPGQAHRAAAGARSPSEPYLQRILNARVYEICIETPLQEAPVLSGRLLNSVLVKREDLQPVNSFKLRGAYNAIAGLSEMQRESGIVACSAGNHAQGVAMSSTMLGIDAAILMPVATPAIKVDAVRRHKGNVILHGQNYDDAQDEALRLVAAEGRTLIHPFDDPLVIAGQGTIGMEVLKQTTGRPLDAIFVCCGGGGMLAGIAAYVKRVRPDVKVIGVEAEDAAAMTVSLERGERVRLETVGSFADGAAVRLVGTETFRLCDELVDGMITVSNDEICAAIKDGFNDTRCVLEPAGALALAGLKRYVATTGAEGQTLCAIASGANMDFDRLRFVSERADASETLLSVLIPERPGAFKEMYAHISPRNVTEFSYRMSVDQKAAIFCSFQSRGDDDAVAVEESLEAAGFGVKNLDHNEMAKVHARHLAGGRAPGVVNERLFRFEFPEQPGALNRFLDSMEGGWNVSLFHYRNHGADVGRVLVGIQVGEDDLLFSEWLEKLDFRHVEETDNHCAETFL